MRNLLLPIVLLALALRPHQEEANKVLIEARRDCLGYLALADDDVAEALGLTDDQRNRLDLAILGQRDQLINRVPRMGIKDPAQLRIYKATVWANSGMLRTILTPEQLQKFNNP